MNGTLAPPSARPGAAVAVAVLAAVGVAGSVLMTVLHVDLYQAGVVPLLVPAGFALGAVAFAAVAFGAWVRAPWAWPLAVLVNAVGLLSALFPWRGPQAVAPVVVTLAALAVLLSAAGRAALLRGREATG